MVLRSLDIVKENDLLWEFGDGECLKIARLFLFMMRVLGKFDTRSLIGFGKLLDEGLRIFIFIAEEFWDLGLKNVPVIEEILTLLWCLEEILIVGAKIFMSLRISELGLQFSLFFRDIEGFVKGFLSCFL